MNRQAYQPIACGLHELYQLASMRGDPLYICWENESEGVLKARLRIVDVYTRDRAEYLSGKTASGEYNEIRLDRIIAASWAESGVSLDAALE